MTTRKKLTATQEVVKVILVTLEISTNPKWRTWAEKWLSGEDRTEQSAWDAWGVATAGPEWYAAIAARLSVEAATLMMWAVKGAVEMAKLNGKPLDLSKLEKKAMTYK
jgi:hypothetical protein